MSTAARETSELIANLERRVEDLERAPRLANASIEGYPLTVNDETGQQRQVIGAQPDGTYTTVDVNGPPPPMPSQPTIEERPGALVITWDGKFLDDVTPPADWDHTEVHVSPVSGYDTSDETEIITFHSLKGGSVTVACDPVAQYVRLQSVSTSRTESAATPQVEATPLPPTTGAGGIKTYYEDEPPVGLDADDDGALWFDTNDGNHPYRWDGPNLVWVSIQDAAIEQAQQTANDALDAATTDGEAPTSSPDPITLAGIGMFIVRWTAITNADPVRYQVHVSSTLGFTPDADTMVGETSGTQFSVRALPGPEPADGEPDPRTLNYDTTYYVRVVAVDADGAAPASLQAVATVFRVTGVDLAADSVTAANIVAGTLTGELFSATVIVAGMFKTAETGQRVEWGAAGIKGYKANGDLMVSIPTEDGQEMILDGEFIARRLTVLGGASFQSINNEVTADAALTLMRGISAPSATPQLGVTYDTIPISTASLTPEQKTGALGTFDLVPSEVYCMEWKDASVDYWVLHQIRPGGTRAWFFRVSDGAPVAVTGSYFSDYTEWAIYSAWEIPSGPNAGVYRMACWLPSGSALTYYMWSPAGLNRYSRQNGAASPAIGSDGTNIFTAEVINGSLRVRYWNPDGEGDNLTSPLATYESGQGYTTAASMCTVLYGTFDVGANRYATAQRGVNYNARLLNATAGSPGGLYPAGSGNNWASANKEAFSWESPTTNRRGIAWDAGNNCFWTFGADGFMYKHTGEQWDPAVSSSTYWGKLTFYDSNPTGGTHETAPGTPRSYFAKRRAKNEFVPPALPGGGGSDAPDRVRLYMARGDTAPANGSYHLQYEGATPTTFTTLATATATPPTLGNFPQTTPARIRNDDDTLVLSGDGSAKTATFVSPVIRVGTDLATGDNVAVRGPYWAGHLDATSAPFAGNSANFLVLFTEDEKLIGTGAFTYSAGILTCNRAGLYDLVAVVTHSQTNTIGVRFAQIYLNSNPVASDTVPPPSTGNTTARAVKDAVRIGVGSTLRVFAASSAGAGVNGTVLGNSTGNLTYFSAKWAGP